MPKGSGRRGQSQQQDLPWHPVRFGGGASCPEPGSATGMGSAPGDHGGHQLLPGAPAHCPSHPQVIHQQGGSISLARNGPSDPTVDHTHAKCGPQPPLPGTAGDCSRLQGKLAENRQEHNGATGKGKNQKCEIKRGNVGVPRERRPLGEVHGGQTALEN